MFKGREAHEGARAATRATLRGPYTPITLTRRRAMLCSAFVYEAAWTERNRGGREWLVQAAHWVALTSGWDGRVAAKYSRYHSPTREFLSSWRARALEVQCQPARCNCRRLLRARGQRGLWAERSGPTDLKRATLSVAMAALAEEEAPAACGGPEFDIGDRVRITGIQARPELTTLGFQAGTAGNLSLSSSKSNNHKISIFQCW